MRSSSSSEKCRQLTWAVVSFVSITVNLLSISRLFSSTCNGSTYLLGFTEYFELHGVKSPLHKNEVGILAVKFVILLVVQL